MFSIVVFSIITLFASQDVLGDLTSHNVGQIQPILTQTPTNKAIVSPGIGQTDTMPNTFKDIASLDKGQIVSTPSSASGNDPGQTIIPAVPRLLVSRNADQIQPASSQALGNKAIVPTAPGQIGINPVTIANLPESEM
jgi:hypothetical protein